MSKTTPTSPYTRHDPNNSHDSIPLKKISNYYRNTFLPLSKYKLTLVADRKIVNHADDYPDAADNEGECEIDVTEIYGLREKAYNVLSEYVDDNNNVHLNILKILFDSEEGCCFMIGSFRVKSGTLSIVN